MKVLLGIVDPEERKLFEKNLKNFLLVFVTDGPAAVSQLKTRAFDVAVLDSYLPGMDAVDILMTINEERYCPIVVCGYFQGNRYVAKITECGADLVLNKPVYYPTLSSKLTWLILAEHEKIEKSKNPADQKCELWLKGLLGTMNTRFSPKVQGYVVEALQYMEDNNTLDYQETALHIAETYNIDKNTIYKNLSRAAVFLEKGSDTVAYKEIFGDTPITPKFMLETLLGAWKETKNIAPPA